MSDMDNLSDSMDTVLDFGENIEDVKAPDPLPPGDYPAKITKYELAPNKSDPDKTNLVLYFTISEDNFPAMFENPNGSGPITLRKYYPWTPSTAVSRKTIADVAKCTSVPTNTSKLDLNDLVNEFVKVNVINERAAQGALEGQLLAQVRKVLPLD